MKELIYETESGQEEVSDSSFSDEEIASRNCAILNEAEIIANVGAVVGIRYIRNRSRMVEVFDALGLRMPKHCRFASF